MLGFGVNTCLDKLRNLSEGLYSTYFIGFLREIGDL